MITVASDSLSRFLRQSLGRNVETLRVARPAVALVLAGASPRSGFLRKIADQVIAAQRPDGGWSDTEETVWSACLVRVVSGDKDDRFTSARGWLRSQRKPEGGWGRHERDMARISMTGLVSALIPDVVERRDVDWMRSEWQRDFGGPVRLSYKGGFFLLGMPRDRENTLVSRTISHLAEDQNEDGGFAPWRGHPIGSDPWSTGVVLWGLSKWIGHVDPVVVEKALHWLGKTQLPSGYWPYHYLDDGTSLALIGAVYAMKASAAGKSSCAPLS